MREPVKTFEVEEKEDENIYCDLCGSKTDDPYIIYVKDKETDNAWHKIVYGVSDKDVILEGDRNTRQRKSIDLASAYYSSKHDICESCIANFNNGEGEYIYPVDVGGGTSSTDNRDKSFISKHRALFTALPVILLVVSMVGTLSSNGRLSEYYFILTIAFSIWTIYMSRSY